MTKKAEKAAEVAANKRNAYVGKVRRLIFHVAYIFDRQTEISAEISAAFESKIPAETCAANIASREPVGKAVHPLKEKAVAAARVHAEKKIEHVRKELESAGWDREKVAPYPSSHMERGEYKRREAKYYRVHTLTRSTGNGYRRPGEPDPCEMDPECCARFIARNEESAAFQFDQFIVKLVGKIGESADANLQDVYGVWGLSILTVTKPDGSIQKWKTQEITNVSKLGLYFPQWPTRLMKGGG